MRREGRAPPLQCTAGGLAKLSIFHYPLAARAVPVSAILSQQSCLCLQRQDAQDALVDAGRSQRAVCGGIAHYFGVDSTLVRLIAVVLFFAGGLSLWVYIIAGLIMTETPDY